MRIRKAVALVFGLGLIVWSDTAIAQDCGNWSRPVVCRADLLLLDSDRNTDRLVERDDLELAPRERIELEIEARDQRGSRFPLDRFALAYDDYRCDSMLRIEERDEGRLEIEATASEGRCTLQLWLPNNLNFVWEIDIEIDPRGRTEYARSEAEVIANALYVGLLGREPDDGGFRGAVSEIERGNLESQVSAMVRSEEFQRRTTNLDSEELLGSLYEGILGRGIDSGGVRQYLDDVQRRRYADVVLALLRSPEFEQRLTR